MLWVVAVITMAVGSVIAIVQSDVKRMLAYSSIAHAGFILVGVLAFDKSGVSSVLFYLFAYGFATVGAFALVTLVRDAGGEAEARTCPSGPASAAVTRWWPRFLAVPAGLPWAAADQRLHREVRGVLGGGRATAAGCSP